MSVSSILFPPTSLRGLTALEVPTSINPLTADEIVTIRVHLNLADSRAACAVSADIFEPSPTGMNSYFGVHSMISLLRFAIGALLLRFTDEQGVLNRWA